MKTPILCLHIHIFSYLQNSRVLRILVDGCQGCYDAAYVMVCYLPPFAWEHPSMWQLNSLKELCLDWGCCIGCWLGCWTTTAHISWMLFSAVWEEGSAHHVILCYPPYYLMQWQINLCSPHQPPKVSNRVCYRPPITRLSQSDVTPRLVIPWTQKIRKSRIENQRRIEEMQIMLLVSLCLANLLQFTLGCRCNNLFTKHMVSL